MGTKKEILTTILGIGGGVFLGVGIGCNSATLVGIGALLLFLFTNIGVLNAMDMSIKNSENLLGVLEIFKKIVEKAKSKKPGGKK